MITNVYTDFHKEWKNLSMGKKIGSEIASLAGVIGTSILDN